jgi:hypothetical protein
MPYGVSFLHEVLEILKVIGGTVLGPLFPLRDENGDPTVVTQRIIAAVTKEEFELQYNACLIRGTSASGLQVSNMPIICVRHWCPHICRKSRTR